MAGWKVPPTGHTFNANAKKLTAGRIVTVHEDSLLQQTILYLQHIRGLMPGKKSQMELVVNQFTWKRQIRYKRWKHDRQWINQLWTLWSKSKKMQILVKEKRRKALIRLWLWWMQWKELHLKNYTVFPVSGTKFFDEQQQKNARKKHWRVFCQRFCSNSLFLRAN